MAEADPAATVASALCDLLELEGVERVFGIPGGALLAILAELKSRGGMTYHLCRQETGAAYIADGYARVSGGLGVVLVTSGPGATNALTGAMNADAAGSPLLVITGEIATAYFGMGYLQEGVDAPLDVIDLYRSAVGYSEMLAAPSDAQELVTTALRVALGVPKRAAHLSVPNDIAASPIAGPPPPLSPASYRPAAAFTDVHGIEAAVDVIATARRPLLMLGDACRRPLTDDALLADLVAAVEALSVPVVTEPDAKGIFPESHDLSLRTTGIAGCEWLKYYLYDVDDADGRRFDALVVLGSALGELATSTWSPLLQPAGPVVQCHDDPRAIGRAYPLTVGLVSEMGAALRAFVDCARTVTIDPDRARRRREAVAAIKHDHSPFADPDARASSATPIRPPALVRLVNERLPVGSHVVVDAGNCVGWCLNNLVVDPPTRAHFSLAMGPMGFAVGAVVGAKLAAPDAVCVAVVGDGGFMMQLGEVATAAQYGIGAVWVVLADHDLAMVSQGMAHFTGDPSFDGYYRIGWSDLAQAARGLGAEAYDATSTADTAAALDRALAGASQHVPQVVCVAVDPTDVPPYYPPPFPPAGTGA